MARVTAAAMGVAGALHLEVVAARALIVTLRMTMNTTATKVVMVPT